MPQILNTINKLIIIISALSVIGCASNKSDYQQPILPPNAIPLDFPEFREKTLDFYKKTSMLES